MNKCCFLIFICSDTIHFLFSPSITFSHGNNFSTAAFIGNFFLILKSQFLKNISRCRVFNRMCGNDFIYMHGFCCICHHFFHSFCYISHSPKSFSQIIRNIPMIGIFIKKIKQVPRISLFSFDSMIHRFH